MKTIKVGRVLQEPKPIKIKVPEGAPKMNILNWEEHDIKERRMRYIKFENRIYKILYGPDAKLTYFSCYAIANEKANKLPQAEKVEELCDYYIVFDDEGYCSITQDYVYFIELYVDLIRHCRFGGAYGAIRTKKGLIYVAEKDRIREDWKLL